MFAIKIVTAESGWELGIGTLFEEVDESFFGHEMVFGKTFKTPEEAHSFMSGVFKGKKIGYKLQEAPR